MSVAMKCTASRRHRRPPSHFASRRSSLCRLPGAPITHWPTNETSNRFSIAIVASVIKARARAGTKLDLTLRAGAGVFREPYVTLVLGKVDQLSTCVLSPVGVPGGLAGTLIPVAMPPETMLKTVPVLTSLSYKSPLIELATSGKHYDVKLDEISLLKLMAWIDLLCPYRGEPEIRAMPDPDPAPYVAERWPIMPRMHSAPIVKREYCARRVFESGGSARRDSRVVCNQSPAHHRFPAPELKMIGSGSGAIVSSRHVLTNRHVVMTDKGAFREGFNVLLPPDYKKRVGARVMFVDGVYDLAVLELAEPIAPPRFSILVSLPPLSTKVTACGFPTGSDFGVSLTVTGGQISRHPVSVAADDREDEAHIKRSLWHDAVIISRWSCRRWRPWMPRDAAEQREARAEPSTFRHQCPLCKFGWVRYREPALPLGRIRHTAMANRITHTPNATIHATSRRVPSRNSITIAASQKMPHTASSMGSLTPSTSATQVIVTNPMKRKKLKRRSALSTPWDGSSTPNSSPIHSSRATVE